MKNSSFAFFFGIWSLCLFDVGAFFCPIIKTEKDFGFADWGNDKNCVIFFVECSPRKVTQCICMVCERLIGHEWLPFPNCAGTIYTNIRLSVYDRSYTTGVYSYVNKLSSGNITAFRSTNFCSLRGQKKKTCPFVRT